MHYRRLIITEVVQKLRIFLLVIIVYEYSGVQGVPQRSGINMINSIVQSLLSYVVDD